MIQQSFDFVTWLSFRYVNMVTALHDCTLGTISLQPCINQWFYNRTSLNCRKLSSLHLFKTHTDLLYGKVLFQMNTIFIIFDFEKKYLEKYLSRCKSLYIYVYIVYIYIYIALFIAHTRCTSRCIQLLYTCTCMYYHTRLIEYDTNS